MSLPTDLLRAILLALLFAAAPAWAAEPVVVVGVTDGDTIKVVRQGRQERIRLHGIDAPESKQPFGRSATRALGDLLRDRAVSIEPTSTDRYGRIVALVYAGDDVVNREMVRLGRAWVWPRYCRQDYCAAWRRDQDAARSARRGLWRDKSPTPPWQWRSNGEDG